jgi:ribosomal protein S13
MLKKLKGIHKKDKVLVGKANKLINKALAGELSQDKLDKLEKQVDRLILYLKDFDDILDELEK